MNFSQTGIWRLRRNSPVVSFKIVLQCLTARLWKLERPDQYLIVAIDLYILLRQYDLYSSLSLGIAFKLNE